MRRPRCAKTKLMIDGQWPPRGINDTAMETAIKTIMIHSNTSMRLVDARFDILL